MPSDRDLFQSAVDIPDAGARAEYLSANAPDSDQRARVERLLIAHAAAGGFLEQPPDEGNLTRSGAFGAETGTYIAGDAGATVDRPGRDEHVGAVLAGKYKLIEAIGEGGMGSVYMAQQTEPVKRAVAVKVIKAGMDSKAVLARFEAERQALAMMDHPNIAKVLDAGTTDSGRPFFVMELVKGVPITQYCDERKLTPRQRLELFVPVCNAIQHAHQKGIIHRDIKPNNVLVALYDDRPVPKVIDFGVAKAAGQSLTDLTLVTGFGAVVGTPEYMSPEQANLNNLDIDTRSDVYSLGVLLYELLTGSTPVDRKSLGKAALLEILRIVREVEAPRPSAKLSTIDALPNVAANRGTEPAKLSKLMRGELDWVVLKALEKDRTRRYESANGLARDIQRYLADEIVEARPASAGYRLRKLVRRHKGRVIAAGSVFAALLAGIVGTTWGLIRAENAREDQEHQRRIAESKEAAAKESEARAVKASETAKESARQARLALGSADKMLDFQAEIRRGKQEPLLPAEAEYLAELAGQLEAQAKAGRGANEAEAYTRLAAVQFRQGKTADIETSFEAAFSILTTLCQSDPENAPEHVIQLAKTRSKLAKKFFYPFTPENLKKCESVMRRADAEWIRAGEFNPQNADVFATRAAELDQLHGNVIPMLINQPYTPENQSRSEAARLPVRRAAAECWAKAVELRPDNPTYRKWLQKALPPDFKTGLRWDLAAALRFPDQPVEKPGWVFERGFGELVRDGETWDTLLLERLVKGIDGLPDGPTWVSEERVLREVAAPWRELLLEFPGYKYATGAEIVLKIRQAYAAVWTKHNVGEVPPAPTREQEKRRRELLIEATALARRPDTQLPPEYLSFRYREKRFDESEGKKSARSKSPVTPEEYIWFHRLGRSWYEADAGELAALEQALAGRKDWKPTPLFRVRLMAAFLPSTVMDDPNAAREKLTAGWDRADEQFALYRSEVPHDRDYQDAAMRHSTLALAMATRLLSRREYPGAKAAFTRCIQLVEEKSQQPNDDDSRYRARCYFDRGNANFASGDWTSALADYRMALTASKKKPGEFDNLSVPGLEPTAHFRSGAALLKLGKFEEAENAFDECLRFRRAEVYQSRPLKSGKRSVPWNAAVSELDRTKEYLLAQRWNSAVTWAKIALKTLEENEEAYPVSEVFHQRYALHTYQADALDKLGLNGDAVKEWDEAKKYATPAELRRLPVVSAASFAHAGRHADVAKQLEELAKSDKLTGDEIYDLACAFASCSLGKPIEAKVAENYLDRAMEMLRRAAKAGYRDTGHAAKDTDLDPLRNRDDFKKLLAELGKGTEKK